MAKSTEMRLSKFWPEALGVIGALAVASMVWLITGDIDATYRASCWVTGVALTVYLVVGALAWARDRVRAGGARSERSNGGKR